MWKRHHTEKQRGVLPPSKTRGGNSGLASRGPHLEIPLGNNGPDDQGEELGGNPKKKTAVSEKGEPMQASPGSLET